MDYAAFREERQGFLQEAEILLFGQWLVVAGLVELREAGILQDVEAGDFLAPFIHIIIHHTLY